MNDIALGIDLATASARCVAVDVGTGAVVAAADGPLPPPDRRPGGVSTQPAGYATVALDLVGRVCRQLGDRARTVVAVAVTGTSGTVVPCDDAGVAVGAARLYDDASHTTRLEAHGLEGAPTLGRILALREELGAKRYASTADVVGAVLTGQRVASDTSHPLKAGIDPVGATWPSAALRRLGIDPDTLPPLVPPGTVIGRVAPDVASRLGLPAGVLLVAGMTDGCTAQIATGAVRLGDSVGVLGTTLVLKAVSPRRIEAVDGGVYSHLGPDGAWWAGGASNTGAGVLAAAFPHADLAGTDDRVAARASTVVRYPLARPGERFPVPDRSLPSLESAAAESPDDAYRAVLDGVAFVERLGLERLEALGAFDTPAARGRRHLLAGGATASPVWNRIRATTLAGITGIRATEVTRGAGSAVGAAVLAAYGAAGPGGSFALTVDAMVGTPTTVLPDPQQTAVLAERYRRFLDLVATATAHPPAQPKEPPVSDPTPPADAVPDGVRELVARSNRLGSDPAVTNYGGGNTSAKVTVTNPASGAPVDLLYVKGSGGDLGTLTASGLAVLERDRLVALDRVYRGVEHEDEMVGLFAYCGHGAGGAAPSIDTPMHGLVEHAHVDHLHPDAVIALACAVDGPALVEKIWGGAVAWVPWRRPGWELGRSMHDLAAQEGVIGAVLGGHGLTAWGATSDEVEARSLRIIREAAAYLEASAVAEPFGGYDESRKPLPENERRARATALFPHLRAVASRDSRAVGHLTDTDAVLDFLAREKTHALVHLGTSCPDHFLRTKVRPLLLDTAPDAPLEAVVARLAKLEAEYRDEYRSYYDRHATPDSPAMRGAAPAIILVPGVGMFSFGADKQTARVAGEFYVNAINVMRGAEGVSTYAPVAEAEKFAVEYWILEEQKLQRKPKPKPHAGRVAFVTGGASGIGLATVRALAAEGAHVVVADLDRAKVDEVAQELGGPDRAAGVVADVTDPDAVVAAVADAVLAFGGVDLVVNNAGITRAGSLADTSFADWDLQYEIMPRGSFAVAKAVEPVLRAQELGGDIVNICSKNAVFAGPNNIAYSSAKAAQAHMVRLLAAELGDIGVRVNGINPDGIVRGSGIFAGGWGASRAKTYGVAEEDLGKYYAQRTVLKEEVLPEHVASAVVTLTNGSLPVTTGLVVPVDSGVPQAFMR